ncbi:TonB family protein [Sphingomonas psychrotolerans]|uniref:TonB C-terminal domain-containing protein n=1 Tax=Sphingomonas psychrotolerans TaxID=1327635 RepID=A0A2K8MFT7_9SPHN|nr:TonB family protein [Sphingomonas psychrotolerans]ATY31406.1 hypothetical protein CVN68_04930 [Sphingomonas psychrotolerans]
MFRLFLMTLAVLAASFPAYAQRGKGAPDVPLVPDLAARAKPQGDPSLWMGEDDYPRAAWRAEQQGHVGVLLRIGADGRVSDCSLLASSGSKLLDERSCTLMTRRARFIPAIGKNGRPAPDRWNYSLVWTLPTSWVRKALPEDCSDCGADWSYSEPLYPRAAAPRGAPQTWLRTADYPARLIEQRGGADVELTVASSGRAIGCRVIDSSGSRDWDRALCSILRRRARFDPARNGEGKRVRGEWTHRYLRGPSIAR